MWFSQLNNWIWENHETHDANNSACYLEMFKILIKWAGFYYSKWKYFVLFYCMSTFRSIPSWKSVKQKVKVQQIITDIKKKWCFLIQYQSNINQRDNIVCDDIEWPLGMLALHKGKPCSTLNFKDVGNKMAMDDCIFWEKYWISVKRLIFCKSGTSL